MKLELTGYFTDAGLQLLAKGAAGTPLTVSRVLAGKGATADGATALDQPVQQLEMYGPLQEGQTVSIQVTLPAAAAEAPYALTELGVYVRDAELGEVLFQLYRLREPIDIAPGDRLVLRSTLRLALSGDLHFTLALPPEGFVLREELAAKADLMDGQVPYLQTPHLTANRTLYVDGAAGDDANPGTKEAPYRTIQAAVDALPRDLSGRAVTIQVAAGTYDEDVVIRGFHSGGIGDQLRLKGGDGSADTHRIRTLFIVGCGCCVHADGFSVNGNCSGFAVCVTNSRAILERLRVKNTQGTGNVGIGVGNWGGSMAHIAACQVDGFPKYGIQVNQGAVCSVRGTSIQNCTVGLQAGDATSASMGLVCMETVTFSGNTADTGTFGGSRIFEGEMQA